MRHGEPPDDPTKRQRPQPAKPRHPVVQFIHDSLARMPEDDAETIALIQRLIALVRQHRTELLASGFDADRFIAGMQTPLANYESIHGKTEAAQEAVLQSAADVGDASRQAFHAYEAVVQGLSEVNPFDPDVQEAKEFLEEWRQHMPKE